MGHADSGWEDLTLILQKSAVDQQISELELNLTESSDEDRFSNVENKRNIELIHSYLF